MNNLANRKVPIPLLYVKSANTTYAIRSVFATARAFAPCLLILEDIDTIVTPYTRSYFFNEADGLERNDGIMMIASTNHRKAPPPPNSTYPRPVSLLILIKRTTNFAPSSRSTRSGPLQTSLPLRPQIPFSPSVSRRKKPLLPILAPKARLQAQYQVPQTPLQPYGNSHV